VSAGEATIPRGRAYWYFVAPGYFYIDLPARDGEPAFVGQFLDGPGCDPTAITDADAGAVAWHMLRLFGATVSARAFAEVRRSAWQAWREIAADDADQARRAADPHEPEPTYTPWWAREERADV
jgi:hypothetical protein